MRILRVSLFAAIATTFLTSWTNLYSGQQKTSSADLSEMREVAVGDPIRDFQSDAARNDLHFVAIKGITLLVPGVGGAYQIYGIEVRTIKGTSDYTTSEEQFELTKKAMIYAEKYNEAVLKFLANKANQKTKGSE